MAVTEIAQTCAYYSLTKGGPYTGGSQCYTGAATSGSFTLPATPLCGAFYFVVRTTDTQNLTSDVSAEVVKNFPCRPNAPSNFTVS